MIGLIGKKIGMTQFFDDQGVLVPVTVVSVGSNLVVRKRTVDVDGYDAVLLGYDDVKPARLSRPVLGQFKEGVAPKRVLCEFRDFSRDVSVGDALSADLFGDVRFVDVVGMSKGKGFAGVMKRHGFGGGRATHGSKFHREPGSTGNSSTPGNTKRGRKMPGRMGNDRVTVQNLRVMKLDLEAGLMLIKGCIPGVNRGYVFVQQAVKRK
ncbi:MAG: 50S ribosomal protein L3 [Spirochaetia bacterium]